MMLKLGDKVKHKQSNLEGYLVYSSAGASVSGFDYNDDGNIYSFQTLGFPLSTYQLNWNKVDEFQYNMKRYEEEYREQD